MASAFTGILKNQILSRNTHLETSLTQKKKMFLIVENHQAEFKNIITKWYSEQNIISHN